MGNAAVEFPQHPFGCVLAREEVAGGFDEVVEVEAGAGALAAAEFVEEHVRKTEEGCRTFVHAAGIEGGGDGVDAVDL